MKRYEKDTIDKLCQVIRSNDKDSEKWLVDNGFQELKEFWDAVEGVESSFRWLLDNHYRQLAATGDALNGNDQAKVFLLSSGNRELAAFVEASDGSQQAVSWLLKYNHPGWVRVAKEIYEREKKRKKNPFWNFLNFGNPFR